MRTLLLEDNDGSKLLLILAGYVIAFIIGVFITRWIFGIDKIVDSLTKQNDYSLAQIRLLREMLLYQGATAEDVDAIIENVEYASDEEDKAEDITDPVNKQIYEELKAIERKK